MMSCQNTNQKELEVLISQNNRYYELTLAEYKAEEEMRESDSPATYDKEYQAIVFNAIDAIANLRDVKAYDTIFEAVKKISYESKVKKIIDPIQSNDKEVLKNNLYVNLLKAINTYKRHQPFTMGTHCRLSPYFKFRKVIEKDSVKLDIYGANPYQLTIDSVMDGNRYTADYKSNNEYKVWSIRYKPKSKTTSFHGKILYKESGYSSTIYIQDFDETIKK